MGGGGNASPARSAARTDSTVPAAPVTPTGDGGRLVWFRGRRPSRLRNSTMEARRSSRVESLVTSPSSWIYVALRNSMRDTTTVRAVATSFGFMHMGRFAAAYRDAFGESPSETLNRHLS